MLRIRVQDLSIQFPIPATRRGLFKRAPTGGGTAHILRDVSAEFHEGECVGILGHNGAGKSTFLRTLAGVYQPISGSIAVHGDIRSLFSLHAGLDAEASGRRNIYLIGLAQGIPYPVLRHKEEEIIEFSGLAEFIDRPVRTYSNGMAMRLAFSVSTCQISEIMLIDEIIATGDLDFQNRSLARTFDIMSHSVLFVIASHDCHFLGRVCGRGIVFSHGRILFDGPIADAIEFYTQGATQGYP
jgi:lipopolysaccharide transport system ATP-binding protein